MLSAEKKIIKNVRGEGEKQEQRNEKIKAEQAKSVAKRRKK
jgi:hypothetical protein